MMNSLRGKGHTLGCMTQHSTLAMTMDNLPSRTTFEACGKPVAGLYARISLDLAGESLGVSRQLEDCQHKARTLGWTVSDTYVDNDTSATSSKPRPQYQRLIRDLEQGRINAVVVYDLDRLTRRPIELEHFIDIADRLGVSLANVAGDIDLASSGGRMVARIKGAVARQEAERLGERVSRQKQQRASAGLLQGSRYRVYGYDRDWNIVTVEAEVIREAFTRRASGESTTSIANDLTNRGFTGVNDKPWTSGVLSRTLSNATYAGLVSYKGQVISQGKHTAIVDLDTFNSAQAELANSSMGHNSRRYLLSGILVCSLCNTRMKGNPSSNMYRCSTTYGGCGRLSIRIRLADQAIREVVAQYIPPDSKRNYDDEVKEIESRLTRLQDGYQAQVYTLAEVQPLIAVERRALVEIAKLQKPSIAESVHGPMNLSQERTLIGERISRVVVHPLSKGMRGKTRLEVFYQA